MTAGADKPARLISAFHGNSPSDTCAGPVGNRAVLAVLLIETGYIESRRDKSIKTAI